MVRRRRVQFARVDALRLFNLKNVASQDFLTVSARGKDDADRKSARAWMLEEGLCTKPRTSWWPVAFPTVFSFASRRMTFLEFWAVLTGQPRWVDPAASADLVARLDAWYRGIPPKPASRAPAPRNPPAKARPPTQRATAAGRASK